MKSAWRIAAAGLVALALTACSSSVKVGLSAGEDLNTASGSTPLPVVVRVYQLADDSAFKHASFHDLWKREQTTLGPSLLGVKEVVMQPNSEDKIEMPLDEKAKFVAGIALFRNPNTSKWRFIKRVSDNFVARNWHKAVSVGVDVRLNQNQIEIAD